MAITIFKIFIKAFLDIYILVLRRLWRFFSRLGIKYLNVVVYKSINLKLITYGDIAEILFSRQILIKYDHGFENDVLNYYVKLIKPNTIIFDIGANIGLYSLVAAKCLKGSASIYAFEPSNNTYNVLLKNIELNGFQNSIRAEKIALSEKSGFGLIEIDESIKKKYEFGDAFMFVKTVEEECTNTVRVFTIDEYICYNQIEQVDLIKIDIEGAELLCLKGGDKLLKSKNKPVILFECAEQTCERFNYNKIDLLLFLASYGYKIKEINDSQYIAIP